MTHDRAEQALRTVFEGRATAFEPVPLSVDEVRARRRPRRVGPMLAAAAAVVLLVTGLAVVLGQHHRTAGPAEPLPPGWRWESHANVMVGVPSSWGYAPAPASDWCATRPGRPSRTDPVRPSVPSPGYVDTRNADGAVLGIGCFGSPPASLTAPHLSFSTGVVGSEISLPSSGWIRESRTVGATELVVTMQASRRALADRILATAHVVTRDQSGCPVRSPIQDPLVGRPRPAFDVARLTRVDSIAVCQYQLDGTGPGLVASRLITGGAADAELGAIKSAPTNGGPNRRGCDAANRGPTAVVLRLTAGAVVHDLYATYSGDCGNGIDDGTHVRTLTTGDCRPLFADRVIDTEGIKPAFDRCTS